MSAGEIHSRRLSLCACVNILVAAGSVAAQSPPIVAGFERLYEFEQRPSAAQGRVLLGELGCTSCHIPNDHDKILRKTGPDLADVGARIDPEYLREWLRDPHQVKPGATMPDVFGSWAAGDRDEAVEALVHFLASQGGPFERGNGSARASEDVALGEELFHTVGCVACHAPRRLPRNKTDVDDPFGAPLISVVDPVVPSVPLPDLRAKTNRGALTQFLLDPLSTWDAGRMPNMKLRPREADAVASYLLASTDRSRDRGRESFRIDPDKALQGAALFVQVNCAACHTLSGYPPKKQIAPSLAHLATSHDGGCLARTPKSDAPWYALDERERAAIRLALAGDPAEDGQAALLSRVAGLNCLACHERDGLGGIELGRRPYFTAAIDADLGDEGRIPPTLSGIGAKLTEQGFASVLENGDTVRPYMATRMPYFGVAQIDGLAHVFFEADRNDEAPSIDVTGLEHHHRNRYGRQLMGTEGLSCISCHGLAGNRSIGIPAIDLATSPQRLQPSWFKQYLLDPAALRPGTRMPAFFPEGKSEFTSLFNGNADQQIEALWIYLREIDQTRLPVGMEPTDNFELVPTDRPILLRTFMADVGTHSIAVGFPEGIHVAFDALNVRFALAWRGRFIDAESTWSDRFTPFVEPLGEDRKSFAEGMPFAGLAHEDALWPLEQGIDAGYSFKGYRLDGSGVPTFLYNYTMSGANETAPLEIEERVSAKNSHALLRRITIEGVREMPLYLRVAKSETNIRESEGQFFLDGNLRIHFRSPQLARIRSRGSLHELLIVVPPKSETAIVEWEMAW